MLLFTKVSQKSPILKHSALALSTDPHKPLAANYLVIHLKKEKKRSGFDQF